MEAGLPVLPVTFIPLTVGMAAWYRWEHPDEIRRERKAKGLCVRCGHAGQVPGVRQHRHAVACSL